MAKGTKLHQLTNVSSADPEDGQSLVYDASSGEWKPSTIASGLSYAVGQATMDFTLNTGSYAAMAGLNVTAPADGTYLMLLQLEMNIVQLDMGMAVLIQLWKNGALTYGNLATWEPVMALSSGAYQNGDEIEFPYTYHGIYTLNAGDVLEPRFQVSGGDGLINGSEINSTHSRITLIKLA